MCIRDSTNGIVARIMSLFNRRGYFVKKMSAGVTNKEGYARLTLTVDGDKESLDQIQKQVYKIIDVVKVKIFPEKDVIRRELMLLKVKADEETRSQIVQIANIYLSLIHIWFKENIEIKGRLNRHDFTDKDVEEQD